jgi:signal transduction histidine kinase
MAVQADGASEFMIALARAWILSKVLLAVGLLLLAMEDEIDANVLAGNRERRIRTELQTYAQQPLNARNLRQFDEQTAAICSMIAKHSRFHRVALLLRNRYGRFTVTGSAGLDRAAVIALNAALEDIPAAAISPNLPHCIPGADARTLDLHPWLRPGDDLETLRLTRFTVVLLGRAEGEVDGAFLLSQEIKGESPLVPDDLLPLQILAERVRRARAQSFTMGKLIDAERSTGVGLLAIRLAQQLHNPLTVVLGYASLLGDMIPAGQERNSAHTILLEARRMRAVLDRLAHLSRQSVEHYTEFSIDDVLADAEQLYRTDFLCASIEFALHAHADLPSLYGNSHRIRQALMHLLQYAISAVERQRGGEQKSIQIDAQLRGDHIRIQLQHNGPQLTHPERVFQALDRGQEADVTTGIGLSLSAEILREYGGTIEAANLEATGGHTNTLDARGVRITLDIPLRQSSPRL